MACKLGIPVEADTVVSDYMMRYIKKDLTTLYEHYKMEAA